MVTKVHGQSHAFLRMDYGGGEFVDVDAAGDDVGAEAIRVTSAGALFPQASPLELTDVPSSILLAAADAATASDYRKTARALVAAAQAAQQRRVS
jgi:hypothetical protein